MMIGIDASRAFLNQRTGIEEYSYQVIRNLAEELRDCEVVLYIRKNQKSKIKNQNESADMKKGEISIPENWIVKIIGMPRLWTQVGLSLEMLLHPVDKLFIPAHTVPLVHPDETLVTIHGLEYEFCPDAYSWWEKIYMRLSIKSSCRWAKKIICVSENTKWDLVQFYGVPEKKIEVSYEGYDDKLQIPNSKLQTNGEMKFKFKGPYLLFVGRVEERKNIGNVIKAFDIFKEVYREPHKLVLAGKPGFNYEKIKCQISDSKYKEEIIELGYVSEEEKWALLQKADVFVFPTLYEGFGIPVLEAQSVGVPVVAGRNSSIPEVAGDGAILVDVRDPKAIAKAYELLVSDRSLRENLIKKGLDNVKRFSWSKCAKEISLLLK